MPYKEIISLAGSKLSFDSWESEVYEKTGLTRWETALHLFSIDCVKAGFMVKENTNWVITQKGEDALSLGPKELLDEASRRYKEWESTNKTNKKDNKSKTNPSTNITINGKKFIFTHSDILNAFHDTSKADWQDNPGRDAYSHVLVGSESKPIKSVFRKLPGVPAGFEFNTHQAARAFKALGFETIDMRITNAKQQLSLIGTWKEVVDEHGVVEEAIKQRGGWASWWSFPIEEAAQHLLTTPFYIYLNSGRGVFPYRMKVVEYQTSRGNDGIPSPWPGLTDESCRNITRAGEKQSEVFKTWLKISEIEALDPPLSLSDMALAESLSHSTNVLNQNRFGYVFATEAEAGKKVNDSFWWVNQGGSYEYEKNGSYIFAPLEDAGGGYPSHWSNLGKVKVGDVIFHYAKGLLRAVSKVHEAALETERPDGSGKGEKGLLVRTTYTELTKPLPLTDIPETLRINEKGPFNVNGAVNQGYLFPISGTFASCLNSLVNGDNNPPVKETYKVEDALSEVFVDEGEFREILDLLRYKKNIILQGPPGVGKTFIAKRLAYAVMEQKDPSRVEMIQFHQSYSYEDFIQGYRPNGNGGFERKDGIFFDFCDRARKDHENGRGRDYFFIIDEINRGNLSKIFGELLMLIESDKRDQSFAVPLTYAHSADERFYIPPNLHFIGTMNTADRSLAMVDYALRRRFSFVDLKPNFGNKFSTFLEVKQVPPSLIQRIVAKVSQLNDAIASDQKNLGPGFCIGHSFFCPNGHVDNYDDAWFQMIVKREVAPLLREYWFDDENKAQQKIDALLAP